MAIDLKWKMQWDDTGWKKLAENSMKTTFTVQLNSKFSNYQQTLALRGQS